MKAEWHLKDCGYQISEEFLNAKGWEDSIQIPISYRETKNLDMWEWLDQHGTNFNTYRIGGSRRFGVEGLAFTARTDDVLLYVVEFLDPEIAMMFKLTWCGK